jgi:hypothetical protein
VTCGTCLIPRGGQEVQELASCSATVFRCQVADENKISLQSRRLSSCRHPIPRCGFPLPICASSHGGTVNVFLVITQAVFLGETNSRSHCIQIPLLPCQYIQWRYQAGPNYCSVYSSILPFEINTVQIDLQNSRELGGTAVSQPSFQSLQVCIKVTRARVSGLQLPFGWSI